MGSVVSNDTISLLLDRIAAHGTQDRAEGSKAYLKSQLHHLGARVGDVRRETRRWIDEHPVTLDDLSRMWDMPIFEAKLAAVEAAEVLHPDVDARLALQVAERWTREAGTWALVDPLATKVVPPLLASIPDADEVLDRWAADGDFWVRRAALLALLPDLRAGGGDFDRFGRYADDMLDETEFFIRKAIGWVLRDTGRKRPDLVYQWILPRADRASGVTIREAVKPLTAEQRRAVLEARKR